MTTANIRLKSYGHVVSQEDLGSGLSASSIATQITFIFKQFKRQKHIKNLRKNCKLDKTHFYVHISTPR